MKKYLINYLLKLITLLNFYFSLKGLYHVIIRVNEAYIRYQKFPNELENGSGLQSIGAYTLIVGFHLIAIGIAFNVIFKQENFFLLIQRVTLTVYLLSIFIIDVCLITKIFFLVDFR